MFSLLSSSTCHSQGTLLLRRCFCSVAYKLDLRRAHAPRRHQACLAATPLWFSRRCKDRLFSRVSLPTENDPIVTNYTISPKACRINQCLLSLGSKISDVFYEFTCIPKTTGGVQSKIAALFSSPKAISTDNVLQTQLAYFMNGFSPNY